MNRKRKLEITLNRRDIVGPLVGEVFILDMQVLHQDERFVTRGDNKVSHKTDTDFIIESTSLPLLGMTRMSLPDSTKYGSLEVYSTPFYVRKNRTNAIINTYNAILHWAEHWSGFEGDQEVKVNRWINPITKRVHIEVI